MAYEIGFIPKGWDRGQKFRIWRINSNGVGYIEPDTRNMTFDPDKKRELNDIAVMAYQACDVENINIWLAWWRE